MTTTQLVLAGDPVQLFANVSSCGPVYFRWQRNGIEITGDDTSSLYLPHTTTNDTGIYSAIAINNYGSSTGIVAHLTISEQAPEILQDPMSQTIYAGGKTVFSVSVRAGPPADRTRRHRPRRAPAASLRSEARRVRRRR